ncbi:MAG: BON domain-containing protein [Planctomycetaceae bacterium]|nr:BON domain-containing protein [Planctomycetaceae bacterium]
MVSLDVVLSNGASVVLHRMDAPHDVDLRRRVQSFLHEANMPGLRQLDVEARDGIVTLSGTVRTYYEKQLSQQRCKRVAGVIRLVDNVEVAN